MEQQFSTEHILKTKEFKEFFDVATHFCVFIETYRPSDNIDFLKATRKHLLRLYQSALDLPWVDLQSNLEYGEKLNGEEFDKIVSFITTRLGETRYYWHVFDPTKESELDAVCGDLVDDIQDIYQDIKFSFLTFNLDQKECKENALWQFKFDFDKHWDDHCINALSGIHFFLQNEWT